MISVIIPTWNEEENVARAIGAAQSSPVEKEILVVDADSTDRTQAVAREAGARVLSAVRQRAAQMNLGAEHARGQTLLFLHADTALHGGALDAIESALKNERVVGGGFARRFDSGSMFLKCTCALAEMRNRAIGWFLGDQAIFVRGVIFEKLGGYRSMDRFEDLDFSRRLGRMGRMVTLRPPVVTSARRFKQEGTLRRTTRDFFLTLQYLRSESLRTEDRRRAVKEHVC